MSTGEIKEYIPVTVNGHPRFHGKSGIAVGKSILGENYSAVRLEGQPFVFGIENGYLQSEKPFPWAKQQDREDVEMDMEER